MFFNYELNTSTWRHFVNKQILMTYHRLLIEKQLKEVNRADKDLRQQLLHNENKLRSLRTKKKRLQDGNMHQQDYNKDGQNSNFNKQRGMHG